MSAILISRLEKDIPNRPDHRAHLTHQALWKKQDKIVDNLNRIHSLNFASLRPTDGTLVVTEQYKLFASRIQEILADVPAFFSQMPGGICIVGNPGAGALSGFSMIIIKQLQENLFFLITSTFIGLHRASLSFTTTLVDCPFTSTTNVTPSVPPITCNQISLLVLNGRVCLYLLIQKRRSLHHPTGSLG